MLCLFLSLLCIFLDAYLFAQNFSFLSFPLSSFLSFISYLRQIKAGLPVQSDLRSCRYCSVYLCCPFWCHSSVESLIHFCVEKKRKRSRREREEMKRTGTRRRCSYWTGKLRISFQQVQSVCWTFRWMVVACVCLSMWVQTLGSSVFRTDLHHISCDFRKQYNIL